MPEALQADRAVPPRRRPPHAAVAVVPPSSARGRFRVPLIEKGVRPNGGGYEPADRTPPGSLQVGRQHLAGGARGRSRRGRRRIAVRADRDRRRGRVRRPCRRGARERLGQSPARHRDHRPDRREGLSRSRRRAAADPVSGRHGDRKQAVRADLSPGGGAGEPGAVRARPQQRRPAARRRDGGRPLRPPVGIAEARRRASALDRPHPAEAEEARLRPPEPRGRRPRPLARDRRAATRPDRVRGLGRARARPPGRRPARGDRGRCSGNRPGDHAADRPRPHPRGGVRQRRGHRCRCPWRDRRRSRRLLRGPVRLGARACAARPDRRRRLGGARSRARRGSGDEASPADHGAPADDRRPRTAGRARDRSRAPGGARHRPSRSRSSDCWPGRT